MLSRFIRDARGGVGPLLALAALPLMSAVGIAIDYSRASDAKAKFQAALDSAALMASKKALSQGPDALQSAASGYVNALFSFPGASNVTVTAQYAEQGGSKVTLNGSVVIPTMFMRLVGKESLTLSGTTTTTWGDNRLRVALVLDNTGSMAQSGKMTALKSAAHNLLTTLQNAATTSDDVYVSIVPFSKDVNMKMASDTYQQSWIDWDLWEEVNGSCNKSKYTTQTSCTNAGHRWTADNHKTWTGCVTDRAQNFDTTNDAPIAGATLYPAEEYSDCPVPVLPLTNDWTALSNKIDAMQPNGNTNQAIGLQVGWQSLTQSPFTIPPFDANYKYTQVIILLTDGLNTQDRWYTSQNSIDRRQEKTCNNVKAGGITIYAVQVNTGGDPTSSLLQGCASDSSKFFMLTTSDQIITTFNQIGTALSRLRLSM